MADFHCCAICLLFCKYLLQEMYTYDVRTPCSTLRRNARRAGRGSSGDGGSTACSPRWSKSAARSITTPPPSRHAPRAAYPRARARANGTEQPAAYGGDRSRAQCMATGIVRWLDGPVLVRGPEGRAGRSALLNNYVAD